ncbi:MAG: DUF4423 domain-containing protein [Pseudobdellovibrionaceae bacterium]|nr:DUF4423 domain-containing protein [Bdellovibrionales bacterium]USN46230.1 MAG: DUF4423 domain-containing protein [Pseudobdellovibrionaceae bacterium]
MLEPSIHPQLGPTSNRFELLAFHMWQSLTQNLSPQDVALLLDTSPDRIRSWNDGRGTIRASAWLLLAAKKGMRVSDFLWTITAPLRETHDEPVATETILKKTVIAPALRFLRGKRTLVEVKDLLHLENSVSFHHWEKGKRDIPLSFFLKTIYLFSQRLHLVVELTAPNIDLEKFEMSPFPADFSRRFFSKPWIPSLYLLIQTEVFESWDRQQESRCCRFLNINNEQLHSAMQTLFDLKLVRVRQGRYEIRKGAFYASKNLPEELLTNLHLYWLTQAPQFYSQNKRGLHKVEQATMSHESFKKILGWVEELRGKIKEELKTTTPETMVHFSWQVCDLLNSEPETRND